MVRAAAHLALLRRGRRFSEAATRVGSSPPTAFPVTRLRPGVRPASMVRRRVLSPSAGVHHRETACRPRSWRDRARPGEWRGGVTRSHVLTNLSPQPETGRSTTGTTAAAAEGRSEVSTGPRKPSDRRDRHRSTRPNNHQQLGCDRTRLPNAFSGLGVILERPRGKPCTSPSTPQAEPHSTDPRAKPPELSPSPNDPEGPDHVPLPPVRHRPSGHRDHTVAHVDTWPPVRARQPVTRPAVVVTIRATPRPAHEQGQPPDSAPSPRSDTRSSGVSRAQQPRSWPIGLRRR